MNKIVRHNFPVSRLPEELRDGIVANVVNVTVEEVSPSRRDPVALEEIFEMARKLRTRTGVEIDAEIRAQRDAWDD